MNEEKEYTRYYESWYKIKGSEFSPEMSRTDRDLYRPIVGKLSSNIPQPAELQAYLSIFHDGAEVPLNAFAKDGYDNGYIEAIAGLLQKGALALRLREGVIIVKSVPIQPLIQFKSE